jgi:hypothetical protein
MESKEKFILDVKFVLVAKVLFSLAAGVMMGDGERLMAGNILEMATGTIAVVVALNLGVLIGIFWAARPEDRRNSGYYKAIMIVAASCFAMSPEKNVYIVALVICVIVILLVAFVWISRLVKPKVQN